MTERFTPVPMGGDQQPFTSAPDTSSRFTPVPGGMGGGQAPTAQPSGGGGGSSDLGLGQAGQFTSLAKSATGLFGGLNSLTGDQLGLGSYFGGLGGSLGGLGAGLGLAQSAASGDPMGITQNLYGLYSAANSLGGFGGPTVGSLANSALGGETGALAGGAGAGLGAFGAVVAAPFIAGSLYDMFDTSAKGFQNNVKNTFGAVAPNVQRFQAVPQMAALNPTASPQDIYSQWQRLQDVQNQFQNTGVENLLKSAGTLTGENTKLGLLGGNENYSATFPNIQGVQNAIDPGMTALISGRLRLSDQYGAQTGKNLGFTPEEYAMQLGPQGFQDAINPWAVQAGGFGALYPGHTDQSGNLISITPEQQTTYDDLMAKIKAIQPGTIEQSLANLFEPYGGWTTSPALTGTGRTDFNTIFAQPNTTATPTSGSRFTAVQP